MLRFPSSVAIAAIALGLTAPSAIAQSGDTIRVGSVQLAPMPLGVDTFDVDFETPTPSGPQRRKNVSIHRTTMERRGRDSVLHVHFGTEKKPYWDVYLHPKTFATLQYEQHTDIDSIVVSKNGDCVTGWVDMEKVPRRVVACDRFTDRFAGTPMDERLIALLPLRDAMRGVLATYAAAGGTPGGYAFSVVGQDTLSIQGKTFRAWRLERTVTSDYGKFVTVLWIDRDKPRALRLDRDFGNGRKSITTLRNP